MVQPDIGPDYDYPKSVQRNANQLGMFGSIKSTPGAKALQIIDTVRADGLIKPKDFSILDVYETNMREGERQNPLVQEKKPHQVQFGEVLERTIPSIDKDARKNALRNQVQQEERKVDKHVRVDDLLPS